jgi:hypothetical protein
MEADWEIEIGAHAPVIDVRWLGFVDLRRHPELARQLPEATELPALAEALARLNGNDSPVWTSKCDVWPEVDFAGIDLDELDAPAGCAAYAMGCYIDLLPRSELQWATPVEIADDSKKLCGLLKAVSLRCCRMDLVIRQARLSPDKMGMGMTAYLTCCGSSDAQARTVLKAALAAFAEAFTAESKLE